MAGKIIADTIEASGSQISLNVGNVTVLTASSTGLTLTPTNNVNINVANSNVTFTTANVTGVATFSAGSNTAPSITTAGDTNTGLYFPAADTIGFVEGGAEVMRIDSDGDVGIGTSTPAYKLDVGTGSVVGNIHTRGSISSGTLTGYSIRDIPRLTNDTGTFENTYIGCGATVGNIIFQQGSSFTTASNTERARIDTSGNLQIGTTDQAFRLSVYETANKVATAIRAVNASYSSSCLLIDAGPAASGGFQHIQARSNFNSSASTVFSVFGNGNVQNTNNSYGAISDIKLKENIADATPKLADLMQVKVRNYNLIGDTTKQIGVIAQELETVFPSMIEETTDRDAENNDLGTTTKAVKYSVFVPMLIKSIQELKVIVDAQAVEIAALKAKVGS